MVGVLHLQITTRRRARALSFWVVVCGEVDEKVRRTTRKGILATSQGHRAHTPSLRFTWYRENEKKKFAQSKVSISGCPVSTAQRAMYEWIGWRNKWRRKKCSVDKPPQNLLLFYTVSDGKSYPLPPTQSKGWLTRPTQASFGDGSRERRQKFVLARKYGENSISSVFFQLQECYQNNNKFSIAWGR